MATIQHVDDERAAVALADLLNGSSQQRPVVVVTVRSGASEPWIGAAEIAREVGDFAEVFLMSAGEHTWTFAQIMAEGTQVFGGAGRVYPVGHEWLSDLAKSPLRFAWTEESGEDATQQLISDALRMAYAAGLVQSLPKDQLRRVSGCGEVGDRRPCPRVRRESAARHRRRGTDCRWSGDRPALRRWQFVEGWYDDESNRLDVTELLRPPAEALSAYAVGDVILAKVVRVADDDADLALYPTTKDPAVVVKVQRTDVTANPLDDLRKLMTIGEVVAARVVDTGPPWKLSLSDVEDDEDIVNAPSLLPAGPPWLVEEPDIPAVEDALPIVPPPPFQAPTPRDATPAPYAEEPVQPVARRPSPTMLDRNRAHAGGPPASPQTASIKALLLKIDGLNAETRELRREQDALRAQVLAGARTCTTPLSPGSSGAAGKQGGERSQGRSGTATKGRWREAWTEWNHRPPVRRPRARIPLPR